MNYKYKTGEAVKEGDVCFYSEDNGTDTWNYANQITEIILLNDVLFSKAIFFTMDDGRTLKIIENDIPVDLRFCVEKGTNILSDFTLVGNISDKNFFDEGYVNKNYAIKENNAHLQTNP